MALLDKPKAWLKSLFGEKAEAKTETPAAEVKAEAPAVEAPKVEAPAPKAPEAPKA